MARTITGTTEAILNSLRWLGMDWDEGPDAEGWDPFDATLLRAVDELYKDIFITDKTWNELAERYNTPQIMDLIFTVGNYNMLAMAINSFGVQLEEGLKSFLDQNQIPRMR